MPRPVVIALVVLAAAARAGTASADAPAAWFAARSYAPGATATLHVEPGGATRLHLQLLRAGAATAGDRQDALVDGLAVAPPLLVHGAGAAWTLRVAIGRWPSGVYFARLVAPGGAVGYAPFVLRPARLGTAPALVVEPTNTWQAYNGAGGDSWYHDPAVHVIDLARPYPGDGLPPHFREYDLGFLRWLAASGVRADVVSDDDLERFASGRQLRRAYRLVVFPGHEEYVTTHVYDLVTAYRDDGGNLAFLSADNFFYRVSRRGDLMTGRTRWRDLGRPEAAHVGAEYVGWDEARLPNKPYVVVGDGLAPWLFAGTGLRDGSRFGRYGIEVDERTGASPPATVVLARVPDAVAPGVDAEMTYYRRGRAQVFDAGVMNLGGSSDWPVVRRLVANLWARLAGVSVASADGRAVVSADSAAARSGETRSRAGRRASHPLVNPG